MGPRSPELARRVAPETPRPFRAFIATALPEELRAQLVALQQRLHRSGWESRLGGGARVVWVKPQALHLTLRFLGDVTQERAGEVARAMERAAAREGPFMLALSALGGAPSLAAPRVLWAELADPGPVGRLQQILAAELQACGISPEKRPYRPHVSLARIKKKRGRGEGVSPDVTGGPHPGLAAAGAGFGEWGSFVVYTYSLFESRLTPGGPCYHERARVELGRGPSGSASQR